MELQVLHFECIPSTVFGKSTTEISHGIDEFVCDLQEQLQAASAIRYTTFGHGTAYIFDLGFDPHIGIDARDEVLYRSPHTLIARCILPPRLTVVERERRRIIAPRDLRRGPCQRRRTSVPMPPPKTTRTDPTSCPQTNHPSGSAFLAAPSPIGLGLDSSC